MNSIMRVALAGTAILAVMTGCGGSGSSSSAPLADPTRGYTGLTTPAAINTTNADDFVTLVLGSSDSIGMLGDVTGGLSMVSSLAARRASELVSGACSGSANVIVNEATKTITAVFTNYSDVCGETLDGKVIVTVTGPESMKMAYVDFEYDGPFMHVIVNGYETIAASGGTLVVTANMTSQDVDAGFAYRVKDYVYTATDNGGITGMSISGRFYHPVWGYITLSVWSGTIYIVNGEDYPYMGEVRLQGAGDGYIRVVFEDSATYTIGVDEDDGDVVFEWSETRLW